MHRSMGGQVEYWARIGRAIEQSGNFSYRNICEALHGDLAVDDLNAWEKPLFDKEHDAAMQTVTAQETRAHEARMRRFDEAGIDVESLGD
jgi:hypothetical protein